MEIEVEEYSSFRFPTYPRFFYLGNKKLEVKKILSSSVIREPKSRKTFLRFKVITTPKGRHILTYDIDNDKWLIEG